MAYIQAMRSHWLESHWSPRVWTLKFNGRGQTVLDKYAMLCYHYFKPIAYSIRIRRKLISRSILYNTSRSHAVSQCWVVYLKFLTTTSVVQCVCVCVCVCVTVHKLIWLIASETDDLWPLFGMLVYISTMWVKFKGRGCKLNCHRRKMLLKWSVRPRVRAL